MARRRTSAAVLEALRLQPDSAELHEQLLEAYADEGAWADPERVECILWMVRHDPRNLWCRTPLVHVDPIGSPEAFHDIEQAWLEHIGTACTDVEMLRGAALFIALEDREEALKLLRRAVTTAPDNTDVWIDVGHISRAAPDRLAAWLEAHRRGSCHPNLRGWIATTAATVGDKGTAESFAQELLREADELRRTYGARLDWDEDGRALWERARSQSSDRSEATRLTNAISTHAYYMHQAHTALGIIAVKDQDIPRALGHLDGSGQSPADHRLRANGPNLALVRSLCAVGEWAPADAFLRRWRSKWPHATVDEWMAAIERRELPDEEGAA